MSKIVCYTAGKMFGLSFDQMNNWRLETIRLFKQYTDEVKVINPVDFYNFEIDQKDISDKEVKDFDLTAVRKSDIVLVNFNYPDSIGTAQELQVAEDNHIPIIAFGTEKAHPWMELNVSKRCITLEEAVKYIMEFYIPILN